MSKRTDLIAAAKELLWEHGFEATSPRAILARSGAGQGSLYHHFKGKLELAGTALDEVASELENVADVAFAGDAPPFERVARYLSLPRDALRGCRLGRLALEGAIREEAIRQPVARYFRRLENLIAQAIVDATEAGDLLLRADPADIAATLVAAVQGGYVLARAHQDPAMLEKATRGALALLERLFDDRRDGQ